MVWRGDREVHGAALEKRSRISERGFESHPLRQEWKERCWSGLTGAPGERVSPLATVGSNPTLSVKTLKLNSQNSLYTLP